MTPRTPEATPGEEQQALLEVVVLHPRDAAAAQEGGADRVLLEVEPTRGGRSPDAAAVSAVVRETDLPVRAMLRLTAEDTVSGPDFNKMIALGFDFLSLGADGLAFGFLDHDLEIDRASCAELAVELGKEAGVESGAVPWTFHRGFDATLEPARAWRDVQGLPGLDAVATAGSSRGLAVGADDLIARAHDSPSVAALALASGGLSAEHVPWLVRAGVRQFGVGSSVRTDLSWTRSSVEAGHVRSWRLLLDDALSRALGLPVD